MKILHINSYFQTSGLFKQLYDRQVKAGYKIDVYVPVSHQFPEDRLATSGDYTLVSRNHNHLDRWLFHFKHRKILKDLLQRYDFNRFELMHAHSLFSNGWLAWQLHQCYGTPYVVAVRNADVRTFFGRMPWLRKMGLDIMKDASQIVFISKNSYNEVYRDYVPNSLKEQLKSKTSIIANGIDDFWHDSINKDKQPCLHQPLKIVTTGKVNRGKRFVQLAEMVEKLNRLVETELHIIGPNWDDAILEQLKTFETVIYHGAKTKEEMADLYRDMDIFALLSYPETFGLVYPEAMSQGLPVIYTQSEGFDSYFDNYQVGVSVEKTDEIGFTEAVEYIIKHYPQFVHNALAGIEHFRWDAVHDKYERLYKIVAPSSEDK